MRNSALGYFGAMCTSENVEYSPTIWLLLTVFD